MEYYNNELCVTSSELIIKRDDKGLIAKTQYANTEEAQKVYNYRADGFPLAESIGFVGIEWKDRDNFGELDAKELGIKPTDLKNAYRVYTKWVLLEYSDVTIPSNPEAIQAAVSKGVIPKEWIEEDKTEKILEKLITEMGEEDIFDDLEEEYGEIVEKSDLEKPYPNEHACRLEDPDKYPEKKRKNCEQKHDGKCIDVIYGIKEGKAEVQALRFNKDVWDEAAAKAVCKDRGGKFEAAADKTLKFTIDLLTEEGMIELASRVAQILKDANDELVDKTEQIIEPKPKQLTAEEIIKRINEVRYHDKKEMSIKIDDFIKKLRGKVC